MGIKFKPFKAKAYVPPIKKKDATDESVSDCGSEKTSAEKAAMKRDQDLEIFEVMYTKHVNQKLKTWEEGIFQYNTKNFKAALFNDMLKTDCIDTTQRVLPRTPPIVVLTARIV